MLIVYQLNKFEGNEECLQTCIDLCGVAQPAVLASKRRVAAERVRICSTITECEEYAKEYTRNEVEKFYSGNCGWEIERLELDTSKTALVMMINYEGMPCHSYEGIKYWKNPLFNVTDPAKQKLLLKQLGA